MPEIEQYSFAALGDFVAYLRGQDKQFHLLFAYNGAYSLFEPAEMLEENKAYFKSIFNNYLGNYKFNGILFADENIDPLPWQSSCHMGSCFGAGQKNVSVPS